jgi:NAD(P)-dependent dehydrogenase (short-subunit alcohol dehydrogenase family)
MMKQGGGGAIVNSASVAAAPPIGRMWEPKDVAEVVVWLCYAAASFDHG